MTRLRTARAAGFNAVLETSKAATKPYDFGCSSTKTLIVKSKVKSTLSGV